MEKSLEQHKKEAFLGECDRILAKTAPIDKKVGKVEEGETEIGKVAEKQRMLNSLRSAEIDNMELEKWFSPNQLKGRGRLMKTDKEKGLHEFHNMIRMIQEGMLADEWVGRHLLEVGKIGKEIATLHMEIIDAERVLQQMKGRMEKKQQSVDDMLRGIAEKLMERSSSMASSLSHIPPEISIAEGHWFRYPIIGEPRYKRTNRGYAKRHPEAEIVFLAPTCDRCMPGEGNWLWCDDDVWGECDNFEECHKRPTPYRLTESS